MSQNDNTVPTKNNKRGRRKGTTTQYIISKIFADLPRVDKPDGWNPGQISKETGVAYPAVKNALQLILFIRNLPSSFEVYPKGKSYRARIKPSALREKTPEALLKALNLTPESILKET